MNKLFVSAAAGSFPQRTEPMGRQGTLVGRSNIYKALDTRSHLNCICLSVGCLVAAAVSIEMQSLHAEGTFNVRWNKLIQGRMGGREGQADIERHRDKET